MEIARPYRLVKFVVLFKLKSHVQHACALLGFVLAMLYVNIFTMGFMHFIQYIQRALCACACVIMSSAVCNGTKIDLSKLNRKISRLD
jgi:hypothetical protein